MSYFGELFDRHGSDKEKGHKYGAAYDFLLASRRWYDNDTFKILEIGVAGGGSLRAWREAFPKAEIHAVDNDVNGLMNIPDGTMFHCGDQGDAEFLFSMAEKNGPFHLIIDDGSHRIDHQQTSFASLWSYVTVGGIYVIEDLETSLMAYRHKWNPSGMQPTLERLLGHARHGVQRRRHTPPSAMYCFFGEMCAIIKMEN